MANRTFCDIQALSKEIKVLFGESVYTAGVASTAVLNLTNDITLTKVALGSATIGQTFTIEVNAAAANPGATVLAVFTGTAAAITVTITPNDGTNNSATPVTVTTANLVELINTGLITGKTPTITDASSLRTLQTATGGGAQALTNGGEGDSVSATFADGADAYFSATAPDRVLRGVTGFTQVSNGRYRITLDDKYTQFAYAQLISVSTTENDHTFQLRSEDVASGTIDFLLQSTDANLADGEGVRAVIFVRNTDAR